MYGSVLVVLSALELFGNTVSPEAGKKSQPNIRQVEPESIADLSGYYTCKGEEAGGKKYSGVVVLTKKNDVYLISWVVGGGANFSGIAVRQGNTLAASWAIASERGLVRGVNLYRVETSKNGNPRMVGRWSSVPGPGVQQPETLTFLKKLDAPE
ncbi:MAG: hypothetical protein HYX68_08335 [Planctomycetes bacterium]|nr:hypothetical protein [Planctomycetota bacterium]